MHPLKGSCFQDTGGGVVVSIYGGWVYQSRGNGVVASLISRNCQLVHQHRCRSEEQLMTYLRLICACLAPYLLFSSSKVLQLHFPFLFTAQIQAYTYAPIHAHTGTHVCIHIRPCTLMGLHICTSDPGSSTDALALKNLCRLKLLCLMPTAAASIGWVIPGWVGMLRHRRNCSETPTLFRRGCVSSMASAGIWCRHRCVSVSVCGQEGEEVMSIPEQFSVSGVDVQNHPVVGPAASGGGVFHMSSTWDDR